MISGKCSIGRALVDHRAGVAERIILVRPMPMAGLKARDRGVGNGRQRGVTSRADLVAEAEGDSTGRGIGISRISQGAGASL